MEYEIEDDPQGQDGEPDTPDYNERSKVTEHHRALKNQDAVKPEQYPREERTEQSLIQKDKMRKA